MSPVEPIDETAADDLVVQAKSDREALGQLYDRYFPAIHRYCGRRLFDDATADDISSEVFLQVARTMRRFPGTTDEDFRRWVYRIATNAVNAHLRQKLRRGELLRRAVSLGWWKEVDAESIELAADEHNAVALAVGQLSLREQTVLGLRFMEGMSYEEAANVMGARPATLRVVASRAISNLRQRLSRRFGPPAAPRKERPAV